MLRDILEALKVEKWLDRVVEGWEDVLRCLRSI